MNKSIYSLVLSDDVVDAVDKLARTAGASRSAMINQILAERVAYVTPEMRLEEILQSLARSLIGTDDPVFILTDKPSGGTLSARTSLKYRYKPTVRYSVEIFSQNGSRSGEMRVSFRTQNTQLIEDLTGFFRCWAALEKMYISDALNNDIVYTISDGRFTRTLNTSGSSDSLSDDEFGTAVADYMEMFDGTMKEYFLKLPDTEQAAKAAKEYYCQRIKQQEVII